MEVRIENSWKEVLNDELQSEYFAELVEFVRSEYHSGTIYPRGKDIFKAFDICKFYDTKVVILGQDPYHGAGQANGLCFSVNENVVLPPSLHNILKEVARDTNAEVSRNGNLERWAKQGVLMLNSVLTVRAGQPGSHANHGWESFTNAAIVALNRELHNLVFLLWGSFAQKAACFIDKSKHLVLETSHPSPFSAHRGFIGCGHFAKVNSYLEQHGIKPIEWQDSSFFDSAGLT